MFTSALRDFGRSFQKLYKVASNESSGSRANIQVIHLSTASYHTCMLLSILEIELHLMDVKIDLR